jgi:hypothetical protein
VKGQGDVLTFLLPIKYGVIWRDEGMGVTHDTRYEIGQQRLVNTKIIAVFIFLSETK